MENKYEQSIMNLRNVFHKTRRTENISVNPTDLYNVIYDSWDKTGHISKSVKYGFDKIRYQKALETLAFYLHSPVPYDRSQKEHWDFAFRKALDEFSK